MQQIRERSLLYERESSEADEKRDHNITEKRKAYDVRKERGHGFFSTDGMYMYDRVL